ncbi:hypothetical protein ABZ851_31130 [Streptomyces sp. NPDC047049]|uniref:hypothetical protein n=1 Tax=Streptomyces sp. NPDC047049 TaxID=3156688 RepID=UPI0033CB070D
MNSDQPVPRELKVLDTASLTGLEGRAAGLGLNQRLGAAWVEAHAAPDGKSGRACTGSADDLPLGNVDHRAGPAPRVLPDAA